MQYPINRETDGIFRLLNLGRIILFAAGCFLFMASYWFDGKLESMFFAILIIWISGLVYAMLGLSGRFTYILFLMSFFSFLLGRLLVEFYAEGTIALHFSDNTNRHILMSLFISLFFLQVGFEGYEKFGKKEQRFTDNVGNNYYLIRLQSYSLILFLISAICFLLMNIERWEFVRQYSYVDLFYKYDSQIPQILQMFGNMYNIIFLIFLATCPQKKECIVPMGVYTILTCSLLLTGDRGGFVINMAIQVVYIFWRQYQDKEIWISRMVLIVGICMLPLVFAGLSYFVYLREGIDIGDKNVATQFIRFFRTYGRTVDLLGYGKELQGRFPQSFYSVGELIDYFQYNSLTKLLFGVQEPSVHTVEYVMNKHSYAHAITYMLDSALYLTGHGKGSSYIAELYNDFGYTGIALGNFMYGVILCAIYKVSNKCPIRTALLLNTIGMLFYSSRGSFFYPISVNISLKTVFAAVALFFMAKKVAVKKVTIRVMPRTYVC